MNLSLYALTEEFKTAMSRLEESGFDDQTVADTLEGLKYPLEVKAQNVAAYALNLEAEADAIAQVETRISERRKSIQAKAVKMREYLKANMDRVGITEIKANDGSFCAKIKKNPPSVVIESEIRLPKQFVKSEVITKPDKTAIKKALQAGENVPGARLEQGTRLDIA
jgi:hypothetical protein